MDRWQALFEQAWTLLAVHLPERAGHPVPHADHEPRPDQDRHVAGVDDLGGGRELLVLDVPGGAQHQPGHLADGLHARPVPARHGLLDEQLVKPGTDLKRTVAELVDTRFATEVTGRA